MAADTLRAVLHTFQRHVTAAELLPVLDAEREFLASLIEPKGSETK